MGVEFDDARTPARLGRGDDRGARARKAIEHDIAAVSDVAEGVGNEGEYEAERQRALQAEQDGASSGASKRKGAMQAGARHYPEPPFPKQHQPKPGDEAHN